MEGSFLKLEQIKIGVIGLGYVGLPLAIELGKKFPVIGYDIDKKRVNELVSFDDRTLEISKDEFLSSKKIQFTTNEVMLADSNFYIVTVPTPVDINKQPDLNPLLSASKLIGKFLKKGDIVVYESTVYPGCTETDCVPVLEKWSSLRFNQDFFVGYSPERINPGDKQRKITDIKKITSGSTPETADLINDLYNKIIKAGTYRAPSIKVAEAAKVVENIQRDINIALINELAIIFNTMKIDTEEVLKAAGSKWNFLPFRPGLVGGHCIGVDPYYLAHISEMVGYHPEIILAARRLNNGMSDHITGQFIKAINMKAIPIYGARILVMGFSFKENCTDVRNTRVIDIVKKLETYKCEVDIYDPWVCSKEVFCEYGVLPIETPLEGSYDAILLAVAHDNFRDLGFEKIKRYCKPLHVIYDLKYIFSRDDVDLRL
jgi:UDP-N-acetyl-D-galactosamine dehydrogenase